MPRLSKRYELSVAVRFPQILDIADDTFIAIVDQFAERHRSSRACLWVTVPIRRETEWSLTKREHVKAPVQDSVGLRRIRGDIERSRKDRQPSIASGEAGRGPTRHANAKLLEPRTEHLDRPD